MGRCSTCDASLTVTMFGDFTLLLTYTTGKLALNNETGSIFPSLFTKKKTPHVAHCDTPGTTLTGGQGGYQEVKGHLFMKGGGANQSQVGGAGRTAATFIFRTIHY